MKQTLLTIFYLFSIFLSLSLQAQTWQWGKSGGGADGFNYYLDHENVRRMATDAQGNVFAISTVSKTALNIDGNPKTHYGQSSLLANGALMSFSCSGTYRWSKIIGGDSGGSIADVQTDALGNVYIIGRLPATGFGNQNHFDSDLVLPYCYNPTEGTYANCKSFYIAKYSNTGILLWTKFPEADDISNASFDGTGLAMDLNIDATGNLYILCYLYPGNYADGSYVNTLPSATYHILNYNDQGTFLSGIPLNMTAHGDYYTMRMARNNTNGNIYLSGSLFPGAAGPVINSSISITNPMFLVAFDALGNYLWKNESSNNYGKLNDIAIDDEGNLYVTGGTQGSGTSAGPGDTFAGEEFPVENDAFQQVPFVVKINPSGQGLWSSNASYAGGVWARGIVLNGNEVAISTDVGTLKWSGEQIGTEAFSDENQGTNPGIVRLSQSTGELLGMKDIQSNLLAFDHVGSIAADHLGNYYLGGEFESQLYTGSNTLLNAGAESDFFIAKYGTDNCDCQVPTCSYKAKNSAAQPNAFDFRYIGQDVYDTVSWDFGDGSPVSSVVNPSHTYTTTGIYNVCVTAVNACDTYTYCKTLDTSILGNPNFNVGKQPEFILYPNPAKNEVNIAFDKVLENTQLEIYDLTGRLIATYHTTTAQGTWQLPLHNMATGVYVVVMKSNSQIVMQKKLQVL